MFTVPMMPSVTQPGHLRDTDLDFVRDQMSADQSVGRTAANGKCAAQEPKRRAGDDFTRCNRSIFGGHTAQRGSAVVTWLNRTRGLQPH